MNFLEGAMNAAVDIKKYHKAIELGEQSICVYDLQKVAELAENNEYFEIMVWNVWKQIPCLFRQLATAYRKIDYFSEAVHCYKRSFRTNNGRQKPGNKKALTCVIHNVGRMH